LRGTEQAAQGTVEEAAAPPVAGVADHAALSEIGQISVQSPLLGREAHEPRDHSDIKHEDKTKQQLVAELEALQQRVAALEAAGSGGGESPEDRKMADGTCQSEMTGGSAVEEERDRLRTLLTATIECLPFGFWALGSDGRYILENAANRAMWGEIVGKRPADVVGDEKTLFLWLDNNRRALSGEKIEEEVELTANGETRHLYNIITPIRDAGHFHGILGVNVDITERRRAEEALRESEMRFRSLFQDSAVGTVVVTPDARFLQVNPAFCEFLGYTENELVGKTVESVTHPECWQASARAIVDRRPSRTA
jgi:PAS domain S-box-containing protein